MRDPARIPRICGKLQQLWEAHADLRFGQFIVWFNNSTIIPFYQEDDLWEAMIDQKLEELK